MWAQLYGADSSMSGSNSFRSIKEVIISSFLCPTALARVYRDLALSGTGGAGVS